MGGLLKEQEEKVHKANAMLQPARGPQLDKKHKQRVPTTYQRVTRYWCTTTGYPPIHALPWMTLNVGPTRFSR